VHLGKTKKQKKPASLTNLDPVSGTEGGLSPPRVLSSSVVAAAAGQQALDCAWLDTDGLKLVGTCHNFRRL
jgi:hypothetical protein